MDTKIDRRKNAVPYKEGEKPSAKSEYFGKSYGQLQRESRKARSSALSKMKKPSISGSEVKGIKKAIDSAMKD